MLTPPTTSQKVEFVSFLENLKVSPDSAPARIIINSRTGTIVITDDVRVKRAAVAHGNLVVSVVSDPIVSQPAPFSRGGRTAVVGRDQINVEQEDARMFLFRPGVSLRELVDAVNRVGAAPGDLVLVLADEIKRTWKQIIYFNAGNRAVETVSKAPVAIELPEGNQFSIDDDMEIISDERGVRIAREAGD